MAFADGSADALLLDSGAYAGRISGFRQGDRIFLNGVQADSASYASGVLTLQLAGVTVATLHVGSGYFSENFVLASAAGSTTITETATPPPPAGSITGTRTASRTRRTTWRSATATSSAWSISRSMK